MEHWMALIVISHCLRHAQDVIADYVGDHSDSQEHRNKRAVVRLLPILDNQSLVRAQRLLAA